MHVDSEQESFTGARRVKRIEAREVLPDAKENPAGEAALQPGKIPAELTRDTAAIDPTLYTERKRKHSHHRLYRFTQMCTGLGYLFTMISILFSFSPDDSRLGQTFAALAMASGIVAVLLAGRTSLSARVKGYAVAAIVVAAIAFILNAIASKMGGPKLP